MLTNRFLRIAAPLTLWLALTGCEDPAKDKPKATVSDAPATTAAAKPTGAPATKPAAAPAGEAITLDAASTVGFIGSKVTGKHEGKFEKITGSIALGPDGKPEGGSVTVEIDMDSVKTDQEKLDGHLKAPDFFDVAKFPKAKFTSTEVKAGGDKGATHTLTGELDLHGVKKTISFPATITVGADAVTATTEFALNRKDFGIAYEGKKDDLIRDEVVIKLDIKAPRKK
ncbi:MAG TPA: YceI family protein [Candidatus Nanopelagicales bacterium]|nr:YceI family protein [Candidatus Nanopelagicales bacterium]